MIKLFEDIFGPGFWANVIFAVSRCDTFDFSRIIRMVDSSSDGTLGKPMLIFEPRLNKSGRMT